ncbi:MAG: transposase [Phycisphaerales bacterium]|nr:transposase [Phycisphaerales bacterium]
MRLFDGRIRKLRRSSEGLACAHELTFSCYRRLSLLGRDRTRQWFLSALDAARRKHELELWAYVITPEHVQVLFAPLDPSYSIRQVLQTTKQPVSRRAINLLRTNRPEWLKNLTSEPTGQIHVWQPGGGYDRNVVSPRTAWSIVRYI